MYHEYYFKTQFCQQFLSAFHFFLIPDITIKVSKKSTRSIMQTFQKVKQTVINNSSRKFCLNREEKRNGRMLSERHPVTSDSCRASRIIEIDERNRQGKSFTFEGPHGLVSVKEKLTLKNTTHLDHHRSSTCTRYSPWTASWAILRWALGPTTPWDRTSRLKLWSSFVIDDSTSPFFFAALQRDGQALLVKVTLGRN